MVDENTKIEKKDEIKEITYQVPPYKPEHILSPEYQGTSNYEVGIAELVREKMERLERLRRDPQASQSEIRQAEEDLRTLDYLYENYHMGMNVFRAAKGGRDKIKE